MTRALRGDGSHQWLVLTSLQDLGMSNDMEQPLTYQLGSSLIIDKSIWSHWQITSSAGLFTNIKRIASCTEASFSGEMKQCLNINQFKMKYKEMIFRRFRDKGGV